MVLEVGAPAMVPEVQPPTMLLDVQALTIVPDVQAPTDDAGGGTRISGIDGDMLHQGQ